MSRRVFVKQNHYMTHFFKFCKHQFVIHPLQNLPFCSRTVIAYFSSYNCSSCSRSCISCLSWTKNIVIHILKVQIRPLVSCLCAYHWTLCLAVSSFSHWNLAIYIQQESSQRGHLSSVQGTRNTRYFIIQCYFWLNILYIYFYLKTNKINIRIIVSQRSVLVQKEFHLAFTLLRLVGGGGGLSIQVQLS